jgi:hypothetical protein
VASQPCNLNLAVTDGSLISGFVYKVDVSLPAPGLPCESFSAGQDETHFQVTLSYNGAPAGPLVISANLAGPLRSLSPPSEPIANDRLGEAVTGW